MAAQFPTSITTQLLKVQARTQTTLTADTDASNTTWAVADTTGWPATGFVVCENETAYYSAKTTTTLTVQRGFAGTEVSHLTGKAVKLAVVAETTNRMIDEIVATQSYLGISGSTDTDSLSYKVTTLEDLASSVTPGENLLVNSAFVDTNEDGIPDWWTVLLTPTVAIAADTLCGFNDNHKQITITSAGAGYEGMVITQNTWLKVRPSTAYTFSIYYKCTAGDTGYIHIHSYNAAVEGTAHASAEVTATTATRYTVTFTTDADATNLFIELATKADGDICIFSHPKLEIGSIVTAYNTSDKLKQISFGPLSFNLDFSTAVPATLTEANGDADQVPLKSVAFTKSDVAFLSPEFDIPITFSGLPILISYRFYAAAASKTHTMEVAFVSRGLSDAKDGAVGSFTAFAQDTSDGTTGDEQINEKLFTAAELGWVAGEEIAMYLRRKNEGGDDTDEVYIKGIKFQYIEV